MAWEALLLAVDALVGDVLEALAEADRELVLELTLLLDELTELVLELVFELALEVAAELLFICTAPSCDSAPWSPFQPALPPGESIWICSSIPLAPLTMLAVFEAGSTSAAGAALGFF